MIPVLYVFNYPEDKKDKAIWRLEKSIKSLEKQDCKIYLVTPQDLFIQSNVPVNGIIVPAQKEFNKPKLINYAIKNYLKNYEYVILSDIDIIWPSDTIERMEDYVYNSFKSDIRVIPYCIDNTNPNKSGFADGNGLVHVLSFLQLHGMDERYIGYGPESHDLNQRLSKINQLIEDKNMIIEHIAHELSDRIQIEKNISIYEESKRLSDLYNLVRNGENWGDISPKILIDGIECKPIPNSFSFGSKDNYVHIIEIQSDKTNMELKFNDEEYEKFVERLPCETINGDKITWGNK